MPNGGREAHIIKLPLPTAFTLRSAHSYVFSWADNDRYKFVEEQLKADEFEKHGITRTHDFLRAQIASVRVVQSDSAR